MKLRNIYLLLAVAGYVLPNIFTAKIALETGNCRIP
jgi:hypothetical protein